MATDKQPEEKPVKVVRKPIGLNYKPIKFMDKWGWLIVIILVGIMGVAMLSFISHSNIGLLVLSGKMVYGKSDPVTLEDPTIRTLIARGAQPVAIVGFPMNQRDIEELVEQGAEKFKPFYYLSDCDGNMCVKNNYYTCENRQIVSTERCKFGCDNQRGCFECAHWKHSEDNRFTKMKGSAHKCFGNDLHACPNGFWEKLLTCDYGCEEQPMLSHNPVILPVDNDFDDEQEAQVQRADQAVIKRLLPDPPLTYIELTDFEGNPVMEAHCSCQFGAPNICVGDDVYQCLGFKDKYQYTKVKQCGFGCEEGKCLLTEKHCKEGKIKCRYGLTFRCTNSLWVKTRVQCSVGDFFTGDYQKEKNRLKQMVDLQEEGQEEE